MILRTKPSLWSTPTKDHQHKRNWKPKPLLEKPCWLYSQNSEVVVLIDFLGKGDTVNSEHWIEPLKVSETYHKKGGRNWWCLASTRRCQALHKCRHNWCHCMFGVYSSTITSPQLVSYSCQFPLVPQTEGRPHGPKLQFWWKSQGCSSSVVLGEWKRLFLGWNSTLSTWAQYWKARLCLSQARTKWGMIEE